ncbi:RusA-like Holliday junction resolvase [Ralstonia phage Anchaing]|uniref:Uncharacterized protein n=1 Tax=Ralstonia phage Anchaing TaxID=2759719 RepID=A0A7G5B898_9CAUD|nr:RusA-like Holliday junction resolvase [Ralstonia phage Anchaing]QMV32521.1 hypothetical protein A1_00001 [Ralstonia phage Anchaing]
MTTKYRINVPLRTLKAALQVAAKGDIRFYLNGVLVQAWVNETRCVAADGHMLAAIRSEQDNDVPAGDAPVEFVIPRDVLDGIKATATQVQSTDCVLAGPDDAGRWTLQVGASEMRVFAPLDGKFPDYRRVIPTRVSRVIAQVNPALLARMASCIETMNGKSKSGKSIDMHLHHNGEGGVLVTSKYNNFVGVIMPVRGALGVDVEDTAWAQHAPAPKKEPAANDSAQAEALAA